MTFLRQNRKKSEHRLFRFPTDSSGKHGDAWPMAQIGALGEGPYWT